MKLDASCIFIAKLLTVFRMPGSSDPAHSMKRTRATIPHKMTDENGNTGARDASGKKWHWYSGVPEYLNPPVKHSQDLELNTEHKTGK